MKENYNRFLLGTLLSAALVFSPKAALSAGISDSTKPDPILSGEADGPCSPALDQPDLTPGTDVEGHQVASADIQTGQAPVQGQIMMPLKSGHRRGAAPTYVIVDGKKLDPLLNPKPACR